MRFSGRKIAVGVGGGIAAYKACDLVRGLRKEGAEVRVAVTPAAQEFVTALTFQALSGHPVLVDYFDPGQEANFGHLDLARWSELFVVAPATADLIARLRAGMANDAVTTSLLAYRGPVLLAPAMNVAMYENARTQENLRTLLGEARYRVVGPGVGMLADGDVGPGRLSELPDLLDAVHAALGGAGPLSGKRVLLTAGPTREAIDPVRFLSNPSTGKMGLSLARRAKALGADVTVVLGPVPPVQTPGITQVNVTSADEMHQAVQERIEGADLFIATAAVSDFKPASYSSQKRKKLEGDEKEPLPLVRTPDVLLAASERMKGHPRRPLFVGFAAETERLHEHAHLKLIRKGLDAIVANDVTREGAGFAGETNHVTVLGADGSSVDVSGTKDEVARKLFDLWLPTLLAR